MVLGLFFMLLRAEMGASLLGLALPGGPVPLGPAGARFSALGEPDRRYLDQQRERVQALARRHVGTLPRGGSLDDLRVLQEILDRAGLAPDAGAELQALGVVLGDVLAARQGLDWVVYHDALGRSRVLRMGDTEVLVFPVTMISKRVELGVPFTVRDLYHQTVREIADSRVSRRTQSPRTRAE